MNTSRSFDQAANIYDQTRPLFEATADVGIQALLDAAGPGAHILEVGTGTGRISIPLLERGANLIGCDLSAKMLVRQREKYPSARLAQSDAVFLPFPSDHFDALITVHVMHLIGPWREALREFKRVLKPGGVLLNVRTYEAIGDSVRGRMRDHWRDWLKTQNVDTSHPGAQSGSEVKAELQALGAHLKEVEAVRFSHSYTLRAELDRYANRVSSDTWFVPDSLYLASLDELRTWVMNEYGDLDQQLKETNRFVFDVASFEASK
jgi:ubiquinone/menaquinone biosynthesis C-methylase UbiE